MLNAPIILKGYGFAYVKYPFSRMEEFRKLQEKNMAKRGGIPTDPCAIFQPRTGFSGRLAPRALEDTHEQVHLLRRIALVVRAAGHC